jgi:uracil-DNA glycosylase
MDVEKIKLVLLGQDPYHGEGQATDLSFSCNDSMGIQPSLRNIFKVIKTNFPERDYQFNTGDLGRWNDEENIFLLNTALTVKCGEPKSLVNEWQKFSEALIIYIDSCNDECVFLLMGGPAQSKSAFISNKTRIIKCVHPSHLSAYRGFMDCKVFIDIEKKVGSINWETDGS